MKIFDFFKKKQKKAEPRRETLCADYSEVSVSYQEVRMVYLVQQGVIRYRNVISPAVRPGTFPEEYLEEKERVLSAQEQVQVEQRILAAVAQCPISEKIDLLPPGASHDAVLRCQKITGENIFYANTRMRENGFSITRDPIEGPFLALFQTLKPLCDFPSLFDLPESKPRREPSQPLDKRYFEETLWQCPRCSFGNLMEHCKCVKCGAKSPW